MLIILLDYHMVMKLEFSPNNQVPTMTIDQVEDMVERDRITNPSINPNRKGTTRTEASKLEQAKKMGTAIDVYDMNGKLLTTFPSKNAVAKALGVH